MRYYTEIQWYNAEPSYLLIYNANSLLGLIVDVYLSVWMRRDVQQYSWCRHNKAKKQYMFENIGLWDVAQNTWHSRLANCGADRLQVGRDDDDVDAWNFKSCKNDLLSGAFLLRQILAFVMHASNVCKTPVMIRYDTSLVWTKKLSATFRHWRY